MVTLVQLPSMVMLSTGIGCLYNKEQIQQLYFNGSCALILR